MPSRSAVVGSTSGLHARPAALFVKAAGSAAVKVRIAVDGKKPVNAASMLGVLSLGAKCGTTVTLETDAEGDDGESALADLASLLERNLDDEPDDHG